MKKLNTNGNRKVAKRYKIILECVQITGECPAYKSGSRIVIDQALVYREDEWPDSELEGKSVVLPTDPGHANCYPFLLEFAPFYRNLCTGISPKMLSLSASDDEGYFTCHNCDVKFYHEKGYETHGNAKFKIKLLPVEKNYNDRWNDYLRRHNLPPFAPRDVRSRKIERIMR